MKKDFTLGMDSKSSIPCLVILMMVCGMSSDFAQDKKECQDQLISLSPCLAFATGKALAPTPTCCTELKKDVDKSKFCLCVLVKDRNEPGLGFKLNATLALSLIPLCQIHTNATVCPKLLHLSPNSPEAQVFEQFGNTSGVGSGTSAGGTKPSSSTKLSVKGVRQTAIIGFLVWVSAICFHQQHLGKD